MPPAPTTAQSLGSLIKSARDIMRKDKGLNGDLDRLPMLTWIMFLKFLDDLELQREEEAGSERIEVETGDSYRLELEDFARAIRGEKQPLLGRADALGQARALAALYISAEEERPVDLSELDREV